MTTTTATKEKHAMCYTYYHGLTQVSNWVRLKFAAMKLKKLARWKTKRQRSAPFPPLSLYLSILHFAACLVPSESGRFSTSRGIVVQIGPLCLVFFWDCYCYETVNHILQVAILLQRKRGNLLGENRKVLLGYFP